MADEYIRREDAVNTVIPAMVDGADAEIVEGLIYMIEPADVVPVVHSRWIKTADGAECERCGREAVYQIIDDHWRYEPFCPHCGAIMDGHREE